MLTYLAGLKRQGLKLIGRNQALKIGMSEEQLEAARARYQLTQHIEGLGEMYAHIRSCTDLDCSFCNEPGESGEGGAASFP